MLKRFALFVFVVTSLLASGHAFAQRSLMADFGDNYASDGQNWFNDPTTAFGFTPPAAIPFALDFGSGPITGLKAAPNFVGQAVFYDSLGNLLPDSINVAKATLPWNPQGSYEKGAGMVDRSYLDNYVYDPLSPSPLQAFRIFWNGVCRTGDTTCASDTQGSQFQAVFFYLSDEAFVLQLNYGVFATTNVDVGFTLGDNVDSIFTNATLSGNGPEYCFADGHQMSFTSSAACLAAASGSTTSVPEPDVASLLALGGLGLALRVVATRRRASRAAAA